MTPINTFTIYYGVDLFLRNRMLCWMYDLGRFKFLSNELIAVPIIRNK